MGYLAGHEPRILHEEILHELEKARAKFPAQDVWVTLAALTEEVGELNQAVLQFEHEPKKGRTYEQIRKEAVQVACMAMRVVLDTHLNRFNPYPSCETVGEQTTRIQGWPPVEQH